MVMTLRWPWVVSFADIFSAGVGMYDQVQPVG
jgi:hypothetical protein